MSLTIDHHLFDNLKNTWIKGRSKPQPTIILSATPLRADFAVAALGQSYTTSMTNCTTITAMADTGCQSCLAGTSLLRKLGLTPSNLFPVKTKMRSANNEGIRLLGAILLKLSGSDAKGRIFSTKQMTYITNCSDTFFLSRGGLC